MKRFFHVFDNDLELVAGNHDTLEDAIDTTLCLLDGSLEQARFVIASTEGQFARDKPLPVHIAFDKLRDYDQGRATS